MNGVTRKRGTSKARKNKRRTQHVPVPINPTICLNSGERDRSAVPNASSAKPVLVVALALITLVVVLNLSSPEAPKNSVATRSNPGAWTIILANALCESHAFGSLPRYGPRVPTPQVSLWPGDLPIVEPWPGGVSPLGPWPCTSVNP